MTARRNVPYGLADFQKRHILRLTSKFVSDPNVQSLISEDLDELVKIIREYKSNETAAIARKEERLKVMKELGPAIKQETTVGFREEFMKWLAKQV